MDYILIFFIYHTIIDSPTHPKEPNHQSTINNLKP